MRERKKIISTISDFFYVRGWVGFFSFIINKDLRICIFCHGDREYYFKMLKFKNIYYRNQK